MHNMEQRKSCFRFSFFDSIRKEILFQMTSLLFFADFQCGLLILMPRSSASGVVFLSMHKAIVCTCVYSIAIPARGMTLCAAIAEK